MRSWQIADGFGLPNLKLAQSEVPSPGRGEVLVRLRAMSLNFRDTIILHGMYGGKQPLPLIPLSDAAGVVEAVGGDVTGFAPGDRVTTVFHQGWQGGEPSLERLSHALGAGHVPGVACDYRLFRPEGIVRTPDHLSDLEAAALPCAAVTAWAALVADCRVEPGETVLIEGTGGVSMFALQFAHAMGMRTIVTSSSDDKLARARTLGADETLNYKTVPEWGKAVRTLTGGRGVDHVIEVGGAGTLEQALKAVRIGGRIAAIGVLSGVKTELTLPLLFMQHVRMQGISVGSRDMHEAMNAFLAQTALKPVIDTPVFAFDALPKAYEHMIARRHFGKICIDNDAGAAAA